MKRYVAVVLVLAMSPWANLYAQETASTTFRVSARVEAFCEIASGDVSLDTTAQRASPLPGMTRLRATCSPDTGYQVALALSKATSPGTDTVTGLGTGTAQDHTVFGAIPASQVLPADGYSESVTVRIYY